MITRLRVAPVHDSDLACAIDLGKLGFDWLPTGGDDGERMVFALPQIMETWYAHTGFPDSGDPEPGPRSACMPRRPGDPRIGSASGLVFTAADIRESVAELRRRGVLFTGDGVVLDHGEGDRTGDAGDLETEFCGPEGNRLLLHS